MSFQDQTVAKSAQTVDSGKIRLGGACRLPLAIEANRPSGTGRKPANTTDSGKIRLGGACRLPLTNG